MRGTAVAADEPAAAALIGDAVEPDAWAKQELETLSPSRRVPWPTRY